MKPPIATSVLTFCLLSGLGAVARFGAWPLVRPVIPEARGSTREPSTSPPRLSAESLGAVLVARDPFRVARRSAAVTYDPVRLSQPEVPPPAKPVLSLVGLVAGVEPTALVEGFPGVEGARVVRVGDVIAGLTVRQISSDGILIVGMDTVWVLTVREPWR